MKNPITLDDAVLLGAGAAQAQTQELCVNNDRGGPMARGAGVVLAAQALEQKATVRVLLSTRQPIWRWWAKRRPNPSRAMGQRSKCGKA
jgi:hypothetical protein